MADAGRPELRAWWITLLLFLLVAPAAWIGPERTEVRAPAAHPDPDVQRRLRHLRAALRLAQARADALAGMVAERDRRLEQRAARLARLERILQLRKSGWVHLIDGRMRLDPRGSWHMEITLVRGGNHRGLLHTWLQLIADGREAEPLPLSLPDGDGYERTLAIDLESHAFVRARVEWPDLRPPARLEALLLDRDGEVIARYRFASSVGVGSERADDGAWQP
ncbi:MAG: hypothetical protein D6682_02590 [Zetaproteobacteria bacterium]|nr:MAG: hypothetical protein D6682_02590 [Zetaproteobacteria bacterium]